MFERSPTLFDVKVGDAICPDVKVEWDPATKTIVSWSAMSRLDARVVFDEDKVTLFQLGTQYRLQIARPKYIEKSLGVKDLTHSVLTPMPCKVLRVDVAEGAEVKKDQALVVIESMKMETVIMSPQDGTIKKVVHKAGDICKAGTALIEFDE